MEAIAPVQRLDLVDIVDHLHGLPEPLGQPRPLQHRLDEILRILIFVILAVHKRRHGHVRHEGGQPLALRRCGDIEGRQGQRRDGPRRGATQPAEPEPRLFQYVHITQQGHPKHPAPFHHQIHILVPLGIKGIAERLPVNALGA